MYFMPSYPVGVKVAALSHKEKCRLFKTHLEVPDTYEHIGGRVLNSSFVSSSSAMARFRDSVEYFDLLRRYSLEYEVESASGLKESIVFSDSELSERLLEMCRNDFHASSLAALDRKSLLRLARIASFRYGARSAQLARLTGIGKETLDRIL